LLLVVVNGYIGPGDGRCSYKICDGYEQGIGIFAFGNDAQIRGQDIPANKTILCIIRFGTRIVSFIPVIVIIEIFVVIIFFI